MTKKFIILFILIFVLNNCGYSPIYSTKYQDFKLSNIIFSGERDINKILKRGLDNYTQNESAEITKNFELGKEQDLTKVIVNQQISKLAFQVTLNVRNKVLSAYKDIMNMPV